MIQHKTIDGLLLRDMVVAGAALLEKNREAVDALNVFPVPDGDTGTNMSLTMQSATRPAPGARRCAPPARMERACSSCVHSPPGARWPAG